MERLNEANEANVAQQHSRRPLPPLPIPSLHNAVPLFHHYSGITEHTVTMAAIPFPKAGGL